MEVTGSSPVASIFHRALRGLSDVLGIADTVVDHFNEFAAADVPVFGHTAAPDNPCFNAYHFVVAQQKSSRHVAQVDWRGMKEANAWC